MPARSGASSGGCLPGELSPRKPALKKRRTGSLSSGWQRRCAGCCEFACFRLTSGFRCRLLLWLAENQASLSFLLIPALPQLLHGRDAVEFFCHRLPELMVFDLGICGSRQLSALIEDLSLAHCLPAHGNQVHPLLGLLRDLGEKQGIHLAYHPHCDHSTGFN